MNTVVNDGLRWGIRMNTRVYYQSKDCPKWANRLQEEKWQKHGLILWDSDQRQVTKLSWMQTASILEYMRGTLEWRDSGITLGEPATRLSIDDPVREPNADRNLTI